jgi:hypothetical protein
MQILSGSRSFEKKKVAEAGAEKMMEINKM